ncbi:thiol:disulfide interchange protein DsbC [Andreprevotia lacus DSM 23236]|uniref:Thiol:disulfide interchange protein n=1 Tax=Andreprevotia lacus DSM 23236 TaxID=1121001 RepID=A0A1W1XRB9_9NEIS|nr:DsbC family protein [Andreprevotia lacus]SMC26395.1 thiol:disulfide interchange protein DsbC [Andreprevotia lacus DSM 23236]
MKKLTRLLAAAGLVALTACSVNAADTVPKDLKAKLQKQLPDQEITSVGVSPVKGLYEVVLGKNNVVYADESGAYVFVGDLIQLSSKQSLTEARKTELMKTDFAKLPFDRAIKEVRGDGSRKLAVFSDPDCPFCHKLEKESLNGVTNVTIYTFLFPLPMHQDAERKSVAMWCASGTGPAAWRAWMDNNKLPEPAKTDCANPVKDNLALGEQLGISGTPALIFTNGKIVPGAIPKAKLEELLAAAAK